MMVVKSGAEQVQTGDEIVVTIKRLGINGEGVGYYKRKAVFVPSALPQEVVKARVTDIKPRHMEAKVKRIEKKSPQRVKPFCPVYERCGGCQLQHLSSEGQKQAKEEIVREAFRRYTNIQNPPLRPLYSMDEPWHYRHKAQLQMGLIKGRTVLGLYAPGSHKLVDISGCPIQSNSINTAANVIREQLEKWRIPPYQEKSKQGIVRTVVIRESTHSGELQVTFVIACNQLPQAEKLITAITRELPQVATIAMNEQRHNTSLIFGKHTKVLWGRPTIEERLGQTAYQLSPRAFFQLNPEQAYHLYQFVAEAAALQGAEKVIDAYCGTGTITLWLAPQAAEIRGIEDIAEAVEDARHNTKLNQISNATFYEGKSEALLPQWVKQGFRPDVIVVDPPRKGCDRKLLDAVCLAKPKRFVYVSCNPATLAKDCKVMMDGGYEIEWIQPVDMFPQTSHVECVALLVGSETAEKT